MLTTSKEINDEHNKIVCLFNKLYRFNNKVMGAQINNPTPNAIINIIVSAKRASRGIIPSLIEWIK